MGVRSLTRKLKQAGRLLTTRKNPVLKVVHPQGYIEVFREPIPAGEIMKRYPRYCITRPDVFEFPWIVVRPESILVPGKVFYLVPHSTLDKLLKAKRHQLESLNLSLTETHSHQCPSLPVKAIEWVRSNHRQQDRYYRGLESSPDYGKGQDSSTDSYYKQSFYDTWNKVRRNLQSQVHQDSSDQLDLGLSSSSYTSRSFFDTALRAYETNPKPVGSHLKSCLRKPDSERMRLHLRVRFAGVDVITGSRRGSPSHHDQDYMCSRNPCYRY